uniref:Transmembrane protein n=1 Tax=Steinernema glaseri TaxID=37863 RepID=A0A1I8AT72_9BILA
MSGTKEQSIRKENDNQRQKHGMRKERGRICWVKWLRMFPETKFVSVGEFRLGTAKLPYSIRSKFTRYNLTNRKNSLLMKCPFDKAVSLLSFQALRSQHYLVVKRIVKRCKTPMIQPLIPKVVTPLSTNIAVLMFLLYMSF